MFYKVALLIAITFIPALELRASIPLGIYKYSITWPVVFVVCTLANIAVGLAWFWALAHLVPLVTRIKPLGYVYNKYVERTQKRIDKAVGKWGEWAVAVFIGIPLPGSGVYTGALAAYLIGLKWRKFVVANIVGVLIAAALVTAVSAAGGGAWELAQKVFFLDQPGAAP